MKELFPIRQDFEKRRRIRRMAKLVAAAYLIVLMTLFLYMPEEMYSLTVDFQILLWLLVVAYFGIRRYNLLCSIKHKWSRQYPISADRNLGVATEGRICLRCKQKQRLGYDMFGVYWSKDLVPVSRKKSKRIRKARRARK